MLDDLSELMPYCGEFILGKIVIFALLVLFAPTASQPLQIAVDSKPVLDVSQDEIERWKSEQSEIKRLYSVGSFSDAEAMARRSLADSISLFGEGAEWVGVAYTNLAACEYQLGKFVQSEASYDKAVEIYESNSAVPRHRLAIVLNNQANSLLELNKFEKAETLSRKSIEILRTVNDPRFDATLAAAYSNLSNILTVSGRFEEAMVATQSALEIDKRIYGLDAPQMGYHYADMGVVYQALYDFDNARYFLEKGIALVEKTDVPDITRLANYYVAYADLLNESDELQQARGAAETAYNLLTSIDKANGAWLASVLFAQADIELNLGNDAAAQSKAEEGLALLNISEGLQHERAVGLRILAMFDIRRGQLAEAQVKLQKAMSMLDEKNRFTEGILIDVLASQWLLFDLTQNKAEAERVVARLDALGIGRDELDRLVKPLASK